ncbi:hypothetical protein PoB_006939300 [Plakobranchus ocellatus]|uniref:Uncharacterized protein n=1 Tax=Plakobranchus ocellatus TaxID=259542 RepID=A0AAV4DF34_9GAST|nr:hypothetical protein PoB_006939300 [Plakobranchus ocellatus]
MSAIKDHYLESSTVKAIDSMAFIFGGLLNRDELYDSICEEGLRKLRETTENDASLPWMEARKNAKKKHSFAPKQFIPFSLADVYEDSD